MKWLTEKNQKRKNFLGAVNGIYIGLKIFLLNYDYNTKWKVATSVIKIWDVNLLFYVLTMRGLDLILGLDSN